jgi:hypothetical protein
VLVEVKVKEPVVLITESVPGVKLAITPQELSDWALLDNESTVRVRTKRKTVFIGLDN